MGQKELLKKRIEEERSRLDQMLEEGNVTQEAYSQSLVLDHLIEEYMGDTNYNK